MRHRQVAAIAFFTAMVGAAIVVVSSGDTAVTRPWFALAGFLVCVAFMIGYAQVDWWSTFAGRASMIFTSATALFMANAVAILWWPGGNGYPGDEKGTELVYAYVLFAALFKLGAMALPRYETWLDRRRGVPPPT